MGSVAFLALQIPLLLSRQQAKRTEEITPGLSQKVEYNHRASLTDLAPMEVKSPLVKSEQI